MPNKFDPYREALVMETQTVWDDEYDDWELADKERIAEALHAAPAEAAHLVYVRSHTGFCRQITVTSDDIERISG